jgi:hypothetical protein
VRNPRQKRTAKTTWARGGMRGMLGERSADWAA